jgi:hypothetical protein
MLCTQQALHLYCCLQCAALSEVGREMTTRDGSYVTSIKSLACIVVILATQVKGMHGLGAGPFKRGLPHAELAALIPLLQARQDKSGSQLVCIKTHISAGNNMGEQAPPEVGLSAEVCWAEKACPVTRAFQADKACLVEGSYPMNRACLVEGASPLEEACPEGASPVETACPVERASPAAEALTLAKLEEGPLTKRTGAPEAVIADSLPESAACRPVTETEQAAAPQAVTSDRTEVLSSQQLEAAALRAASQLISALRYIVAEARRGQPLSLALMLKTHGILMEGLCSHTGQLRKTGCKAGDGFRYPPPKEVRLTIFDLFKRRQISVLVRSK